METRRINTLPEFLEVIGKSNPYSPNLFRGVANKEYELIPSIARGLKFSSDDEAKLYLKLRKEQIVKTLQGLASPYIDQEPKSYIEWVVLAQHFGDKTRLLDWSTSCLDIT